MCRQSTLVQISKAMPDNKNIMPVEEPHSSPKTRNKTSQLRLYFLLPLLLVILGAVAIIVTLTYLRQQHGIELSVAQLRTQASRLYEESLRREVSAMHTVMGTLARDEILRKALERKDRQTLLARATPIFNDMKSNFRITHLYFTGPDHVNLLRVHQPQRYGDVIEHAVMRKAERSDNIEYGLEVGALGMFALRLVSPWHDPITRELLGFVELGMEIDGVLESVHNLSGLDIYVFIKKDQAQRKDWEDGMRAVSRKPEWDRFRDVVLSPQTPHDLPVALEKYLAQPGVIGGSAAVEMTCDGHPCQTTSLPLLDAAGRNLADMVLVMDTSQQVAEARKAVLNDGAVSAAGGAAVFALCFWLAGYAGRRMPRAEQVALQEHTDHDELTGLPKRGTFNAMLKEEISRAQRYRRPLSLLMVDIDHFRRVNDEYGDVVGDHVLKSLAPILQKSLRPADRACRYGGEEFILILPETGEASAREVAERLREAVEKFTFWDGSGRAVMITVSIGVAMLTERSATPQELVNAVNTALHAAKEGGRNRVCFYGKTACDPGEEQVS